MTTKAKAPGPAALPRSGRSGRAARKFDDLPDLIPHRLVADKLGVTPDALRDWVARGDFPEPHSVVQLTWLYRVDLVRAYLETGRWPEGAKFKQPATRREGGVSP